MLQFQPLVASVIKLESLTVKKVDKKWSNLRYEVLLVKIRISVTQM